jgi:uncharacterized protein HemX
MEDTLTRTEKSKSFSRAGLFFLFLFGMFIFFLGSGGYYFWQFYWLPSQEKRVVEYSGLSEKVAQNSALIGALNDQMVSVHEESLAVSHSLSTLEKLLEQRKLKAGSLESGKEDSNLRLVLAEAELLLAAAIGELTLSRDQDAAFHYLKLVLDILSQEEHPGLSLIENTLKTDLKSLKEGKVVSSKELVAPLAALRADMEYFFASTPHCFPGHLSEKVEEKPAEGPEKSFWDTLRKDLVGLIEISEIRSSENITLKGARTDMALLVMRMEFANARAAAILGKLDGFKTAIDSLAGLLTKYCDTSNRRIASLIANLNEGSNLDSINKEMSIRRSIGAIRILRRDLLANEKREF